MSLIDAIRSVMLKTENVDVPEWNQNVTVRELTAEERDQYDQLCLDDRKGGVVRFRARLVAMSIVDGDGRRVLDDSAVDVIANGSSLAAERVFSVAARLSGVTGEDVDDLAKN